MSQVEMPQVPECGARGSLTDEDTMKLMNLPFVDSIMTWDQQQLTCWLPDGHPGTAHMQFLVCQYDLPDTVWWWASWLDLDGHREHAVMFPGRGCDVDFCVLPFGHTEGGDSRHILQ